MTVEQLNHRIEQFDKALASLEEVIKLDNDDKNIIRDSTIRRFAFTLEMGWKLLQAILAEEEVTMPIGSPKSVIKAAYENNMISDVDDWVMALRDRDNMSHLYSSDDSEAIYQRIKNIYIDIFRQL